jgi:hypothetical protein
VRALLVHYNDACFLRVFVSRVSRALFFSPSLCLHKQTDEQLFCCCCCPQNNRQTCVSSKSVKSLISTKSGPPDCCREKEKPDFLRHTDFALISSSLRLLSFFLSFFLSFRAFPFREREGKREREDTSSFPRAREQKRSEEQERDLFLIRKCPPLRNKKGNKTKRLF